MSEPNRHIETLLPAFVLGILSAEETETVRAHLAACSSCREELRAYEASAAAIALAVLVVDPPAALEEQLLTRIAPAPASTSASQPGWHERLQRWLDRFDRPFGRPVGVAATALALLLLLFLVWTTLAPSPFPTVVLAATDAAPGASGLVVSSDDGLHGTLVVQHLPPLDEETTTYQLWLIEAGKWEDGGTFGVDEDGYGARYAKADILLTAYDAFAVTVEPVDGSSSPTGPVVLRGNQ